MRHAGLTFNHQTGLSYNPLTKHYWLGDDVSVNYLVHAVKSA
jgi:2-polyprenyl-6-hydroxyphenyl methylase/3-demethylubiquinone-9 3-methyltransferase